MKKLILLGSTGSIGKNTIDIVRRFPDKFKLIGLAINKNIDLLRKQIREFSPEIVAVFSSNEGKIISDEFGSKIKVLYGNSSLKEISEFPDADTLVNAVVGEVGLAPTISGLKSGKDILLANKETMVAGGEIVTSLSKNMNKSIIPIDSEHSAIFQCLEGRDMRHVKNIILTASGGPFRRLGRIHFKNITIAQALKHPKWTMGQKITIDSATMMNKGLEVIEARWLFDIQYDRIKVVIHPQSVIHSLVEFIDGSILSQLGITDMRIPISHALAYPDRLSLDKKFHLDLPKTNKLTFHEPDFRKFPCLALAYEAGKLGGNAPAIINSANEEAVYYFLKGHIKFTSIPKLIEKSLSNVPYIKSPSLQDIIASSLESREEVRKNIRI